jgi:hypothetical protein
MNMYFADINEQAIYVDMIFTKAMDMATFDMAGF